MIFKNFFSLDFIYNIDAKDYDKTADDDSCSLKDSGYSLHIQALLYISSFDFSLLKQLIGLSEF